MVERIRCTYCGKVNYTSSPRFADKCSYCSKPFIKQGSKVIQEDKQQDNDNREMGEK